MNKCIVGALVGVLLASAPVLAEEIVFDNAPNNGYFVPFNSSTPAGTLYGDSGWLGNTGGTFTLTKIRLGLVTQNGTSKGSTDLRFTLNDGSPSGMVFGSGAPLYETTIEDVQLPEGLGPQYYSITIDVPNVQTLGGFNNIGWSVGVENFDFNGDFGFQCSTAFGQQVGFYTNNASYYDGSNWSLFAFSQDPETGVANFVATMWIPEPTALALLSAGLLLARRR